MRKFSLLLEEVRGCRILIAGQAPGRRVHESGALCSCVVILPLPLPLPLPYEMTKVIGEV